MENSHIRERLKNKLTKLFYCEKCYMFLEVKNLTY